MERERGLGGKYKADGDGYYINTPLGKFRPVDIVDGKLVVMLSAIDKENPKLRKAVERLIKDGYVIGIPVKKLDGTSDMVVRMRLGKTEIKQGY